MAGLFYALQSSVQSLAAQSRGLEVAGKNLANVNNPAYSRQRIELGDRGTVVTPDGAESTGLEAVGVRQLRDALMDRQVGREISLLHAVEYEQSGYQRAQAGLGETIDRTPAAGAAGAGAGLASALDEFFNAFESLAARPADAGERQGLLQKAAHLVGLVHSADRNLAQVQADLTAVVSDGVAGVNSQLEAIAGLNAQIARAEVNAPGSAVDLRDQRQARLEELAAKISFETREVGDQLRVSVRSDGGDEIVLVAGGALQSAAGFDGVRVTAGTPAAAIALAGGSIQGALTARDGGVQVLRSDLERLSAQLAASVNAAYNPTGIGADFFRPPDATGGLALADGLDAASLHAGDGSAAGDNSVALAIARLATKIHSTAGGDAIDGTFAGFFSRTVGELGQSLAGANARREDQAAIERLVRAQRDGISGVSLDEEMGDLMKYQRAFQASSRVFNVVDELLDSVINRLGRG